MANQNITSETKVRVSEQEFEDLHILRRSVYPLIIKLILINFLSLFLILVFNLIGFGLKDSLSDFWNFLIVNLTFLLSIQAFIAILSGVAIAKWISDLYIIKFPEITIRNGIFIIKERKLVVKKSSDIILHQSIFGKIFNYGNLTLKEALEDGSDLQITDVQDPKHLAEIFRIKKNDII